MVSALGVREGLLYELLDEAQRAEDPLLVTARELNVLRSRSPRHGDELCAWTDRFMASTDLEETAEERRLRHAACLLADIGWRAHPDYRGEQSLTSSPMPGSSASIIPAAHTSRSPWPIATWASTTTR